MSMLARTVLPLFLCTIWLAGCDGSGSSASTGSTDSSSTSTAAGIGTASDCWTELPRTSAEHLLGATYPDSAATVGASARSCRRSGTGRFAQWTWTLGSSLYDARLSAHNAAAIRTLTGGRICARMGSATSPVYFVARSLSIRGLTALHIASADSSCSETGLTRELLGVCGGRTASVLLMGSSPSDSASWARTDSVYATLCGR